MVGRLRRGGKEGAAPFDSIRCGWRPLLSPKAQVEVLGFRSGLEPTAPSVLSVSPAHIDSLGAADIPRPNLLLNAIRHLSMIFIISQ